MIRERLLKSYRYYSDQIVVIKNEISELDTELFSLSKKPTEARKKQINKEINILKYKLKRFSIKLDEFVKNNPNLFKINKNEFDSIVSTRKKNESEIVGDIKKMKDNENQDNETDSKQNEAIKINIWDKLNVNLEAKFTGREKEISSVLRRLISGGSITITGLKGVAGIGKTAIANEACRIIIQNLQKNKVLSSNRFNLKQQNFNKSIKNIFKEHKNIFEDGILWITFENSIKKPIKQIKDAFDLLGVDSKTIEEYNKLKGSVNTIYNLVDILKGKNILIVLDNAEQNLKIFNYFFKGFMGKFPVLITSRTSIPGVFEEEINKLNEKDAISLFNFYLKDNKKNDIKTIKELLSKSGYISLPIVIYAKLINSGEYSIEELTPIATKTLALLEKHPDIHYNFKKNISTIASIRIASSMLSKKESTIIQYCSKFESTIKTSFLAELLDIENIEPYIINLNKNSLIDSVKDDLSEFKLLPIIKEYFTLELQNTINNEEQKNVELRLNNIIKKAQYKDIIKDFEKINDLVSILNKGIEFFQYKQVLGIVKSLDNKLYKKSLLEKNIEILKLGIKAAIGLEKTNTIYDLYSNISDRLVRIGANNEAKKYLINAINIGKEKKIERVGFNYYHYCNLLEQEQDKQLLINTLYDAFLYLQENSYISQISHHSLLNTYTSLNNNFGFHSTINKLLEVSYFYYSKREKENILLFFSELANYYYKFESVKKANYIIDEIYNISQEKKSEISSIFKSYILKDYLIFYINEGNKNIKKELTKYYRYCNIASLNDDKFYVRGRYYLSIQKYKLAINNFNKIKVNTNGYKDFWLGKTYLLNDKLNIAENYLNTYKKHHRSNNNSYKIAKVNALLSLLEYKKHNYEQAAYLINLSISVLDKLKIKNISYEQSIKILIFSKAKTKLSKSNITILAPSFTKPIPPSIVGNDGKKMLLINEGISYFGKGKVKNYIDLDKAFNLFKDKREVINKENFANPVYLLPYYMDEYPVSIREYKEFCESTKELIPEHIKNISKKYFSLPITNISYFEASRYAKWAGKELPTDVEWEKATRGEKGYKYPWGNSVNKKNIPSNIIINKDKILSDKIENNTLYVIKKHPNSMFDESLFLDLLVNSISLTYEEKQRVIDAIPSLSQEQIDELQKIFTEEKKKFKELEKEYGADIRKLKKERNFEQLSKDPAMQNTFYKMLHHLPSNKSPYGIKNLVTNIYEWTNTQKDNSYIIKGSSAYDKLSPELIKAYNNKRNKRSYKSFDLGFRCVKRKIYGQ